MASPDTPATSTPAQAAYRIDTRERAVDRRHLCQTPARCAVGPRPHADRSVLLDRAARIASELRTSGIAQGDRVAISLAPGASRAASALAVWRLGATVVLTDPRLAPRRARQALHETLPAAVIADTRGLWLLRRAQSVRLRLAIRGTPVLDRPLLPVDRALGDALGLPRRTAAPPPPTHDPRAEDSPVVVRDPDADAALVIVHDPTAPEEQTGVYYSRTDVMLLSLSLGDRAHRRQSASEPVRDVYPAGRSRVRTSSAALLASHLP